jgi:hypothetical protein
MVKKHYDDNVNQPDHSTVSWRRPRTGKEREGRGAYKSEEVLRPAISVARFDKDGYGEGPGDEDDEALDAVDHVLDPLEMLGWELHCCSGVQVRLRRRFARTLRALMLCGRRSSDRYKESVVVQDRSHTTACQKAADRYT